MKKDGAFRPRSIVAACILLCLTLGTGTARASQTWTKASSNHFDLYTYQKKQQALTFLRRLESSRQGLQQALEIDDATIRSFDGFSRVTVIAFHSSAEYAGYRSDRAASAYYLQGPERNYIVLGSGRSDDYTTAVHEYAHHLLHQRYGRLPAWLDEGLAEVYSSVQEKDGSLRIGLPLDDRLASLEDDGFLLDLNSLFAVRQTSFANLRHGGGRSRFYAESWLLTHMLRFSPIYASGFNAFLERLASGNSAELSLQYVYRKSAVQVQADLDQYLKKKRLPTETERLKRPGAYAPSFLATTLDPAGAQAMLTGLLAALGRIPKTKQEQMPAGGQ